jgi:TetR/AcrR family transcriptional repressor of nem operon
MPDATASTIHKSRPPGRPREFDIDDALDKAIGIFREHGFHATSVDDLTGAMGLASGSIYKAFKDKRAVFMAAYDRYTLLRNEQMRRVAFKGSTGAERLRNVLGFYVKSSQGTEGRKGCLVVGSAIEMANFDPEIATRVTTTLRKNEAFLAELIQLGQSDGSIPAGIDADSTARMMVCLTQGMRVIGKTGRALPEPSTAVGIAMKLLA